MEVAKLTLPIDTELRFALFGLECALGVSFAGAECERAFRETDEDRISEKRYAFFESKRLKVSGRVDEYEPDSIELQVSGHSGIGELLTRVAEGARFHAIRMRKSTEEPGSFASPD